MTATLRHEGLRYSGSVDLLRQAVPFLTEGIDDGDAVFVAERPAVNAALADALGGDAAAVSFLDITEIGRNPARIIPAVLDFADRHRDQAIRGIGEPLWPGRSEAEAVECHLHEALVNRFFADQPAWFLCLYDALALAPEDLDRMSRTHPVVRDSGGTARRAVVDVEIDLREALAEPLPLPSRAGSPMTFGHDDLPAVRWVAESHAAAAGLSPARCADAAVVVSELTTNSVRHGGGWGTFRHWVRGDRVVYEVADTGFLADLGLGRRLPPVHQPGGRGLWLVNQLCDLVQIRSSGAGTTIRVELAPA